MIFLMLVMFILSMAGYIQLLVNKGNIRIEFAPAVICTGISFALIIAGLLNFLKPMTWIIFIAGLGSFIYACFCLYRKENKHNLFVLVCFLLCVFYFFFISLNTVLYEYDDFTHWAIVVKSMLLTDRIPAQEDAVVTFQAYPLGSSVFIYYVSRIIGDSEACYVWGQQVMIISFLLPLFAFVSKKRISVLALLFSVYALTCNISIFKLLVDTVMPLAGIAAICMIAYDKEHSVKMCLEILPLIVFLLHVKNSGIFFACICWIYGLYQLRAVSFQKKNMFFFAAIVILLPVATLFLWHLHVRIAFANGELTMHAVSLENYKAGIAEKSSEEIWYIAKNLFMNTFRIRVNAFCIGFVLLQSGLLALMMYKRRDNKRFIKKTLIVIINIWLIYFAYVLSLFGMYVFSMPWNAASVLDSFGRYIISALLFMYGIVTVFVLQNWQERDGIGKEVLILLAYCLPIIFFGEYQQLPTLVGQQHQDSAYRTALESLIEENEVERGKTYLIVTSSDDYYDAYLYYLAKYLLWSPDVDVYIPDDNSPDRAAENYDYMIVFVPSENIQAVYAIK